jgi:hypothetical protein
VPGRQEQGQRDAEQHLKRLQHEVEFAEKNLSQYEELLGKQRQVVLAQQKDDSQLKSLAAEHERLQELQGFIARANLYSRRVAVATEIADRWLERLKTDALLWNEPGSAGVMSATYLTEIAGSAGQWLQAAGGLSNPWNPTLGHSSAADLYGGDVFPLNSDAQASIAFCTHYRLSWINNAATDTSLRAEVRVFWARDAATVPLGDATNGSPLCATTNMPIANFHAVYATTIIRYNPLTH